MDQRVSVILDHIQRHVAQPIKMDDLASLISTSPSRLRLLFRKHVGLPPSRYLKRIRLERARELVCTGHRSIKEVMVAVGCNDESHFVRDFEHAFGLSPARYRERHFIHGPFAASRIGQ